MEMTNMMLNFDRAARHQRELIEEAARDRARSRAGTGFMRSFARLFGGSPRIQDGAPQTRTRSETNAATA
jgi:hypothetical protein